MSTNLGSAYFQLIPSLRGAQGTIEKELNTAGAASGAKFSKGFNKSLVGTAALGAGIAVAAVGISKFTGFIGDSIQAVGNWQALNAQSAAAVKATGGAAGVTAKKVNALAQSLEGQTATQAESIQQGANLILTFKGIRNAAGKGNDIFDQTTAAAVDMARAMGTDVPSAALMLGKALNDPAQGLSKLTRSGVTFTDQQKKQIKALQATGDTMGAQKIILKELNSEFGGSGAAYAKTYEGSMYRLSDAIGDFGEKIATAALPGITALLDTGSDIANWATNSKAVQGVAGAIGDAFAGIGDKIKTLDLSGISKNIQGALSGVGGFAKTVGPPIVDTFSQIGKTLIDVAPSLKDLAMTTLPVLVGLLQQLLPILPPIADAIKVIAPAIGFLVEKIVPLVSQQAGVVSFFATFASGANRTQTVLDGLRGKFGPLVQALGTLGKAISLVLYAIGTFVGKSIPLVASFVSRSIAFFASFVSRSISLFAGFISRSIGFFASFVSRSIGFFARLVVGIVGKVGEAARAIGTLPSRARAALGNLGSLLFSSGQALIRGFIGGIASMFGGVGAAVSGIVQFAKDHFPNSPAKRGPLSGAGWRSIQKSGGALAAQFGSGFNGGIKDFASNIGSIVPDTISSSVAGTITNTGRAPSMSVLINNKTNVRLEDLVDVRIARSDAEAERAFRFGYQPAVLGA